MDTKRSGYSQPLKTIEEQQRWFYLEQMKRHLKEVISKESK